MTIYTSNSNKSNFPSSNFFLTNRDEPPYLTCSYRIIVIAWKADWYKRSARETRTRETDPKMIREAGLTTRSGSWYSPIPLDTGSLARSNNVSVHVHEPTQHLDERTCAHACEARAAVPLGIFFTFASAAKRRGRAYIPRARTVYIHYTLLPIHVSRSPRVARLQRYTLDLSKIIEVSRWFEILRRPDANFISIRSSSKLFRIRFISHRLLFFAFIITQFP